MELQWLPLILLLLALLTGACGASQQAVSENMLPDIYTAAAMTVIAAAGTPTAAATPTRTPAPTSTMELASTATTGAATQSSSYGSVSRCNNSVYVNDVTVEDGTALEPGEAFTKTWAIANAGTCNWSKHYSLVFVSGDDMDGDDTQIGQSVGVGETAELSVELTAPDEAGTYTGYWSLADASGEVFGQKVYVQILVTEDAATSTSTPTTTATDAAPTATTTPAAPTATAVPATPSATGTPAAATPSAPPAPTATETLAAATSTLEDTTAGTPSN